jgi:hypothetical protein
MSKNFYVAERRHASHGIVRMMEFLALAAGALAGIALGILLLPRRQAAQVQPPSRSVVQLAIRLAQRGQRTLLVESGSRLRLARSASPDLKVLGSLAGGALLLARDRNRAAVAGPRRDVVRLS